MPDAVVRGIFTSIVGLIWVIVLTRGVGLRTFSKMTAFDFVITLATGSLLASAVTVTSWTAFVQAMVGILVIILTQMALAKLRRGSTRARKVMENEPLLLMRRGQFIDAALATGRVTRSDVIAKLREANVRRYEEADAVVLETTGDISVLHGKGDAVETLDEMRTP